MPGVLSDSAVRAAAHAAETWETRYRRHAQRLREWGVKPLPFAQWKAYWELFALPGEQAKCST